MMSISKNMYIDKLHDIINKYNNTYHNTTKMKPLDVKSTYIDFNKENNKEDLKFKVGDHVRISKYRNIFAKSYLPNLSEEVFLVKKVKNGYTLLVILMVKILVERFTKTNCKKQIRKSLELKKQ